MWAVVCVWLSFGMFLSLETGNQEKNGRDEIWDGNYFEILTMMNFLTDVPKTDIQNGIEYIRDQVFEGEVF